MATPRFCSQCGSPLNEGARFCARCGSQVRAVPTAPAALAPQPPPQAPAPAPVQQSAPAAVATPAYAAAPPVAQSEPIISIIPGLSLHKGFLGMSIKNYTLVLTPGRMIFVYLDTDTMKTLVNEARQEAKAQGKGAMGQWVAQMGWMGVHIQRLQAMAPGAILAQHPGSFFIPNNAVAKARVKRVSTGYDDTTSNDRTEIHLDTPAGKYKFVLASTGLSQKELKQRLQQTLGAVVR